MKTVEMKGSKSQPSKIYLLYYKQVFIQLNPAVQRTVINERAEEGEGHEEGIEWTPLETCELVLL